MATRIRQIAALGLCLAGAAGAALAQPSDAETLQPFLWQAKMAPSTIGEVNPFRRFSSERTEEMLRFYSEALGFEPLPDAGGGALRMIRYPIGDSEIKLFPSQPSEPSTAGVRDAAGLRLFTFFFADEAEVAARFAAYGGEPPAFETLPDGRRAALVRDPDGEWIELVVVPGARPEELARFETSIGASDLEASRAFYRDVLGLEETGPVRDPHLGVDKYVYRHRSTTINVFAVGKDVPNAAETGGIQYIVWNVEGVSDVAARIGAQITRPLSPTGAMRSVWLADPDGVANYFAQFSGQDNTPPRQ